MEVAAKQKFAFILAYCQCLPAINFSYSHFLLSSTHITRLFV